MLKRWCKLPVVGSAVAGGMLLTAGSVFAADGPTGAELGVVLDTMWLLIAAVLVFFMQAGFALLEAGATRAKNTINIMMKNLLDFSIAALAFWAVGYGLYYGATVSGLFGSSLFFPGPDVRAEGGDPSIPLMASLLFQMMFAGTAATIVSGAMAERTRFSSYLIFSVVISVLIYPIVAHWIWSGQGWLNDYNTETLTDWGFTDFAGSTVVHSVGGWVALMGALILGPRLGRYGADGKSRTIPGHNAVMVTLGTFILWFGWYGFNGGSQLMFKSQVDADAIGLVMMNTTLAAAAGAISAMFATWLINGKPDLGASLNGVLAGLVAITAGCAYVSPLASIIIGLVAGPLYVVAIGWMDARKIDDPVGAVPVHLVNGIWGTLALGLFATGSNTGTAGLLNGGGATLLIAQLVGVVAVGVWCVVTSGILFYVLKALGILRVSREEEEAGLDVGEHGSVAYPETLPASGGLPVGGAAGKRWSPGTAD